MDRISAPVHVLDVVGQTPPVALEGDAIAEGVFRRLQLLEDLGAHLDQALVDLGPARLHLVVDVEALRHLVLLRHLEAQHQLLAVRLAVEGVAGGVRSAMLQGLQHRGHFPADVAGLAAMDQSSNAAHAACSFRCAQGR